MGESRLRLRRRDRLLQLHRFCCFCNGDRPAATVDHAPARICFKGKVGPEGFELPACEPCNRQTALSEQVAALYLRMADQAGRHFDAADLNKLISAVANNAPDCLRDLGLSANEKRRTLRERGFASPPGAFLHDVPVVGIPPAVNRHFEVFLRKMLAALFYRETAGFAGPGHGLILQSAQAGTSAAADLEQNAGDWFGVFRLGSRPNVDIGDQFAFRYGYQPGHGFFGLWMAFASSFRFFAVAGPRDELATLDDPAVIHDWKALHACRVVIEGRHALTA